MHYVVQRMGFRLTRGWVALFLVIAALVGAAFWIGPFRPRPAELQLLALSGDGRFRQYVGIPSAWADTLPPASEATARFPLVLAIHNSGAQNAQPAELALSLPARFRLSDGSGQPLAFRRSIGNPLVRYDLPLPNPVIRAGHLPVMVSSVDTLWLEAVVPSYYCVTLSDSVPEFIAAPPQNARTLATVRIFYSFNGERIRQRQTGLLTVQVDPELVKRNPAPNPPVFATRTIEPKAPLPELTELYYVGARVSWCGDPGQPVEIHSVLWETPGGGRFFVLYHGGVPRKYLFDLNRDSIVELEMWDPDNDGQFEAQRPARMAIPAFLMPFPKPAIDTLRALAAEMDSMRVDSAWLRLFHDTAAGPLRFSGAARPVAAAGPARTPLAQPLDSSFLRVDPGFLRLFNNSAAGPLRFSRALRGDTVAPAPSRPPQPRARAPRLLGVPLEEARRRQQPDTLEDALRSDTLRSDTQQRPDTGTAHLPGTERLLPL